MPSPKLHYSYPLLKISFALAIIVFFVVVVRHLLLLPRGLELDQTSARADLSDALLRPGLNIDTLPLVKIDYGRYKPESSEGGADEADESINRAQVRQLCLTRGYYLGPEATTDANCSQVCGVDEHEIAFTYVSRSETTRIVAGRQLLRPGGYCVPTRMATCNRNTSSVVYALSGWTCIPRTDAFAGEGGNRIVVCNGNLRDNALRVVHRDYIPANLVFGDVYTDRLADGSWRFECLQKELDESGNAYLRSEYNRLHRVRNWCVDDTPFASGVTVDLRTGRCDCGPELQKDANSGKCTACTTRFDLVSKQIAFTSKPCFSFVDTVQQFEDRVRNLRKQTDRKQASDDDDDDDLVTIFPCGYNEQGTASEYTLPRCLNYNIALYQPALPSHNTLNVIDSLAG